MQDRRLTAPARAPRTGPPADQERTGCGLPAGMGADTNRGTPSAWTRRTKAGWSAGQRGQPEQNGQDAKPGITEKPSCVTTSLLGLWHMYHRRTDIARVCSAKLRRNSEVSPLEVRINKEVRNYQESLFFGLSLRQFMFALLAVAVAVGVYFGLRPVLGMARSAGSASWPPFPLPWAVFSVQRHDAGTLSTRVYPLGISLSPTARVQIGQPVRQTHGTFNDEGGPQA